MYKQFTLLIAIVAALCLPLAAQTQQEDEVVWMKLRTKLGLEEIVNAVFTPDDQSILVTDANKKLVEIDVATGEVKREIPNIKGVYKFSDDGQFVYTYDFKKVNYATGEEIGQFKMGETPAYGFTMFDMNEKAGYLIGVQYTHIGPVFYWKPDIYVFDINTFLCVDTIGVNRHFYSGIQITDDGKYFITWSLFDPDPKDTSDDEDVNMLWNAKTLDTIRECPELGYVKSSPDGKWLGSVGGNLVSVFDANTLEKKYEWEQAPGYQYGLLSAIDFSPDSRYLATSGYMSGSSEGAKHITNIHIWDLVTGKLAKEYNNSDNKYDQGFLLYSHSGKNFIGFGPGAIIYYNNIITSINEMKEIIGILYPNPSSGEIILKNPKIIPSNLYVDISDLAGTIIKVLFNGQYEGSLLRFNISDLAAGTYILKAVQNNNTYVYKVIKEN